MNLADSSKGTALLLCLSAFFAFFSSLAAHSAGATISKTNSAVIKIPIRDLDIKAAAQVSYARDIKPILSDNCYDCHSPDDTKGGLDLTTFDKLLLKGKKAGAPVVPGKPDESAIVQYIRGLREPQMPKGNPVLTADQLHLLRLWILAGAIDDSARFAAEQKNPTKNITNPAMKVAGNPASQAAINTLLFDANYRDRLIAQRTIRMALLPIAPVPPKVNSPTFNVIDQFIAAKWQQAGLKEAKQAPPLCDDVAFMRRVYLDVVGVIPTVAEAQSFLADKAKDKRNRLIDRLLSRTNDYAANWTPFWEDALASAEVNVRGGIPTRGNHRAWIRQSFAGNKPYDVFVAELLDPMMPGYEKPITSEANTKRIVTAYIQNDNHDDTVQSAANVAQVFLGTSMKCASCHNHFLNKEWPQARFMAFAGMFATNDLELIRCEKKSGNFIAAKFPFDLPEAPSEVPMDVNERLHRATQLLIDPTNPRFAKAMVNRLWKRYVGIPLFAPVDDFRLDQPASQPELLEWMADDFIRSGYDLKHTIGLILNSRTYQLRYDPNLEDHFDVAKPTLARYYRSPSLRRVTAEQLMDSIQVAVTQKPVETNRLYLAKGSTELTRALGKPEARTEVSTSRSDDVSVVQALELLNGEEFQKLVYAPALINQTKGDKKLADEVSQLYWIAYSRPATEKEKNLGVKFLKADGGEASGNQALGDMAWALFTSPEFQYIR